MCVPLGSTVDRVAVTADVWWSTDPDDPPTILVAAGGDAALIPHLYRTTCNGAVESVPVSEVQLRIETRSETQLTGTWRTVGGGSSSGNSSSGMFTMTKQAR